MHKTGILAFIIVSMASIILSSCGNRPTTVSRYIEIPEKGWAYKDTLSYMLNEPSDSVPGEIIVAVDHSPLYKYSNLWIEITSFESFPEKFRRDTLMVVLSDSTGNWTGTGIASNYQTTFDPLRILLKKGDPVLVRHIMRTDTLRNINRVGLFFIPE